MKNRHPMTVRLSALWLCFCGWAAVDLLTFLIFGPSGRNRGADDIAIACFLVFVSIGAFLTRPRP